MEIYNVPNKVVEKCINAGEQKNNMKLYKLIILAILSGAFIAFGSAASGVVSHSIKDVGIAKLVAGLVFPVGLMMVILLGAELFTSNCLIIMSVANKKVKVITMLKVLFIILLCNFVGAMTIVLLNYASGQLDYSNGLLGAYTIKTGVYKANISFGKGVASGILCNVLVCVASLMASCSKDITGKLWAVFFPIMMFVIAGYEHCVANMYFIPAAILAKGNPDYLDLAVKTYGITDEQLAGLNIEGFLHNIACVTIGNMIGGMFFVGLPLYAVYVYKKKSKKEDKQKVNQ